MGRSAAGLRVRAGLSVSWQVWLDGTKVETSFFIRGQRKPPQRYVFLIPEWADSSWAAFKTDRREPVPRCEAPDKPKGCRWAAPTCSLTADPAKKNKTVVQISQTRAVPLLGNRCSATVSGMRLTRRRRRGFCRWRNAWPRCLVKGATPPPVAIRHKARLRTRTAVLFHAEEEKRRSLMEKVRDDTVVFASSSGAAELRASGPGQVWEVVRDEFTAEVGVNQGSALSPSPHNGPGEERYGHKNPRPPPCRSSPRLLWLMYRI